ncbi:Spc24 subunit of Ndc80-domain-containing protein [Durotheca rogersii]|uniref:Spc24 subunit of Ndc80-domain-containing protein n=1 Tax=Durotheca rogersii TaxID=419775 RepID=UPI00221FD33A|nr:Spc24 subunit of Ndc80-domain-containing protein [Durotheca rogersii]KAI5866654.1 Spc24 subunit of Ndc80-domain-containing protein [Durotheca rogersii]
MLLDEDPATLISHTINNFNIAPDKAAVSRVTDSISTLRQARELRIKDAEATLKKLVRTVGTLQAQHEELAAAHSSAAHASEISRLDTQKFRIAKAVSDLEMEAERLAATRADLAARLQELEIQGVEGGVEEEAARRRRAAAAPDLLDDEVLLRLKVYRSLGIDLERGDGPDGEFSRAVVRNDRKGDVHVVNLDKKFSRFFYANYFWQTL